MVYKSLRTDRKTGLSRDNGTLDLQQEEDVPGSFAQTLEIPLAFGDDYVRSIKAILKCPAAVVEDGPRRIGAVVDQVRYLIQAGSLRIGQGGIIEHGAAAHCNSDMPSRQLFDEQPVENDLSCVVGKVQNSIGRRESRAETVQIPAKGFGENLLEGTPDIYFLQAAVYAQIDHVAGNCQPHSGCEWIFSLRDFCLQLREKLQGQSIEALLRILICIGNPRQLAQSAMNILAHRRR